MSRNLLKLFLAGVASIILLSSSAQKLYPRISERRATSRIENYTNYKKPVLDELIDDMNEETEIKVSRNEYFKMIEDFATGGYRGFRVYFAQILYNLSNPDRIPEIKDNLTIIFVGTKANGSETRQENQNESFYFFVYRKPAADIIATLTKTDATPDQLNKIKKEIERYQVAKLPGLERNAADDEALDLTAFAETKSVWYDSLVLNHTADDKLGLYFYLQQGHGLKVDYVNIHFAARNMDEQFEHHLDIVSELHYSTAAADAPRYVGFSTEDPNSFYLDELKNFKLNEVRKQLDSLSCLQGEQKKEVISKLDELKQIIEALTSKYVDTGNPCPTKKCKD